MAAGTIQTKKKVTKKVSRRSGMIVSTEAKARNNVSKKETETVAEARKIVKKRVSRGFSKLKYLSPLHLKSSKCVQVLVTGSG